MGERGQQQRRLHEQRLAREELLLDLGALVYELYRQGKRAPELLQRKAVQLGIVDDEVRALEAALSDEAGEALAPGPEPPTAEADAAELEDELDDPDDQLDEAGDDPDESFDDPGHDHHDESALAEHEEPRA